MSSRPTVASLAALAFALAASCAQQPSGGGDPPAPGRGSGGSSGATGGSPGSSGGATGSGGAVTATGGTTAGGGGAGGDTPGSGGATSTPDTAPPTPDTGSADTTPPVTTPPAANGYTCPAGPYETAKAGGSQGICPGFNIKYSWNEGPTWVASEKAFFFSNFVIREQGPGDMIKFDPATNKCEIFIQGNGCNGLAVSNDGKSIYGACQTPRALMKFDIATKQPTMLVDMVDGKKLDSPNDLAIHKNGTVYFSNTTYELGGRPMGLGFALLRLDPQGMVSVVARGTLNALGLSPDQKRLYAMAGYWDLDDAGVPGKKTGGFNLGGDGIGIDCAGNVYTQAGNIVSPSGGTIGNFPGGTNMAFGGDDMKTLLVLRGKGMQIVKMNVPGLPY